MSEIWSRTSKTQRWLQVEIAICEAFARKRLIPQAYSKLTQGGMLLVEIGEDQGASVTALYNEHGFSNVMLYKDLSGHDRIVSGVRL